MLPPLAWFMINSFRPPLWRLIVEGLVLLRFQRFVSGLEHAFPLDDGRLAVA